MNLLTWLKGAVNKMLGKDNLKSVLAVTPAVSSKMKNAIELWENMYKNEAPWLDDKVHSLGLPALISSEKARMATLEMEIKITGEGERTEFIKDTFTQVTNTIRKELEYGIAFGGLVIKPYIVKGPDNKYKIKINYTRANNFYPLSFSADGELTSAAFVDRIITKDKVYSKLEIHSLVSNTVTVQNRVFVADYKAEFGTQQNTLGNEISITSVPEWADITPSVTIENVDTLLFAYFKNPESNTIDIDSPLGTSGFSRAVSLIKEADMQYSDLLWEYEGGQLAVDVDRTALNPMRDASGKEKIILPKLQDRLFRRNLDLGEDDMYNVYSPALRDDSIINGLNNILMHIEDATSLSRGTISNVSVSEARTATELKILKQRAFAANSDIQKALEDTFKHLFIIIDKYCDLYKIVPSGKYEVAYNWDDSILVDKDSERQIDIVDINNGLMSKVEYRMKWFGETEVQAKESLKEIQNESLDAVKLQQQLTGGDESDNNPSNSPSDTSDTSDSVDTSNDNIKKDGGKKIQRATESNETTRTEEKEKLVKNRNK